MIRIILLRFFESYFRHRWLYLVPVVIMIGFAAYSFRTTKPKYVARGVLYVQKESFLATLTSVRDNSGSWWITPAQETNNELNELMQTDAFIRAVINRTDLEQEMDQGAAIVAEVIDETRKSLWTTPLGNNQLLVNASYEDAQVAYQLVNAVIDGYILWQTNAERRESEVAQSFFTELIGVYKDQLNEARQAMKAYLEAHPEPLRGDRPGVEQLEISRLQGEIDLASNRYASALDKDENARLAMAQIESDARQTYILIDAPRVPEKPETSLKKVALNAGVFVIIGIILSGVAVVGSALLDRSFRFPTDIQHSLSLPALAEIPDVTLRRKWYQRIFRRNARQDTAPLIEEEERLMKDPDPSIAIKLELPEATADRGLRR